MPRRPRIVVIGSIDVDLVQPVDPWPAPGQTRTASGPLAVAHGGAGADLAVAARRLGADVALVGRVGRDAFGPALRDGLAGEGVDVTHVRRTPGASGSAVVLVGPGGERATVRSPGANASVTPADVDAAGRRIDRADAVLLRLDLPANTVRHALRQCRAAGVAAYLGAAPVAATPPAWATEATVLVATEAKAAALLTRPPAGADAVAAVLARRGRAEVVVTVGAGGALHADATGVLTHVPGFAVDVADTTAAGDSFAAGLAVARANGAGWAEALAFANAAGALACTVAGTRPSLPTRAAVRRLLGGPSRAAE